VTTFWNQAVAWLPVMPLAGAALVPIVARRDARAAGGFAFAVTLATLALAVALTVQLLASGPLTAHVGGWVAPYGIALRFDRLGAWAAPLAGFFALVLPFAWRYLEGTIPRERWAAFYALMLLNLGGLIGFSLTADLFNLFLAMEVVSISSYALVAVAGKGTAAWAALKYLLLGAVSSLLVLFAVALLFALTGSLNMVDVAARLAAGEPSRAATLALASLAVAFAVKAALFPLHVWLPDAHAIAPSPVSAVLSGLVVKIGIVGLARVMQLAAGSGIALDVFRELLLLLGAIAIVMGAFLAIFQDDIKLMLAYSTISNVGYIVLGLGLGAPLAVAGALVHVFNHALIKVTLFLAAGSIIHQTGLRTLTELRGVARTLPQTCAAMALGAIAIVGLPPTAGFITKWYIALGAFSAGRVAYGFALVFGALFVFVYYVRMLDAFYFRAATRAEVATAVEPPWSMRGPVLALAVACVVVGLLGGILLAFMTPAAAELLPALGS
jgi:multicomponent Na+:H+ antiporter subunit D